MSGVGMVFSKFLLFHYICSETATTNVVSSGFRLSIFSGIKPVAAAHIS
jgi:hypothetical protein